MVEARSVSPASLIPAALAELTPVIRPPAADTDYIVALPTKTYANGAHCGKYVRVTRVSSGESVVAMVADSCPSCVNNESIDMSYVAFTSIATEEEGMVRSLELPRGLDRRRGAR